MPRRVEVTMTIGVPRERVFDAWLRPDCMARFLAAGDSHASAVDVDPRVGGAFRIVMGSARGSHDHCGRYLEIDRPARLRFTWASPATNGAETEVTVTF
ncbi:MAG: SRPBCC family protein, partial [Gemmatimonadaceae bacterium]